MGFDSHHGPSKAWVQRFRADRLTPESEDWRVRWHLEAYLLRLFGWVLFSSTHANTVDKRFVFFVQ